MPTVLTSFNFEIELKEQLKEVLYRERKSFTDWVHEMAVEYIKRHGAGNPAVPLDKFLKDPQYRACPTILEAEGFNWGTFNDEDLGRFLVILNREINRISHVRLNRRQE